MITSAPGQPEDLWRLNDGRVDCERVFKVARHALGMSWLMGHGPGANETAFSLRLLSYNADILLQPHETAAATDRRPVTHSGSSRASAACTDSLDASSTPTIFGCCASLRTRSWRTYSRATLPDLISTS